MKNKWLAGGIGLGIVCSCALLLAAVPGFFSTVNATTGYQFNGGAGTSGQALCSDGTYFDTPCTVSVGYTFSSRFVLSGLSVDLNAPGTGNFVPTETANPGSSTALAKYDGNGNLTPAAGGNVGAVQSTVTGSRAWLTLYQNTTGFPLEVVVQCNGVPIGSGGNSGGGRLSFEDGATTSVAIVAQSANNNNGVTTTKIVPVGWYYEADCEANGGTPTLDVTSWVETTLQLQ